MPKNIAKPTHRERGFTLIEILIALAITTLLFTVGFASFRDFSRRQVAQNTTREIISAINEAQSYANAGTKLSNTACLAPNTLVGARFNITGNQTYTVSIECSGGAPTVVKTYQTSSAARIYSPSVNSILFKPLAKGTNLVSAVTIGVCANKTGLGVSVSPIGEVSEVGFSCP